MQYYIIQNNQQFGPMEISELVNYGLNSGSMIWAAGMPQWMPANSIEEIRIFLQSQQSTATSNFFIIRNNQQFGPFSIAELRLQNITPDTLVWKEGMPEWKAANTQPELSELFNTTPPPIYTNPQAQYQPRIPTECNHILLRSINELRTWSIILIIFGFLFSCLGGIFAIVAYSKFNNARDFLIHGNETLSEDSYANAKTWFIVACVITGIGLLFNIGNIALL